MSSDSSQTLDSDLSWPNLINCDHLQGSSSQGNTISHYASHPKEEPQASRRPKGQAAERPWPQGHVSGPVGFHRSDSNQSAAAANTAFQSVLMTR